MRAIRIVDVIDLMDGQHRVIWSNGRITIVDDDELAAIEARERKFTPTPQDAA
jgi:hypothetical protein